MERTEKIGLGVATAGHVLLFGLLSTGFLSTPDPLKLNSPPMDVSLVDEVDLKSAAPQISATPPPPSVAPETGETAEPAPSVAAPSETVIAPPPPAPRPVPKPAPATKPVERAKPAPPAPKPAPAKAKPAKPAPAAEKTRAAPPAKEKAKPAPAKPAAVTGKGKTDKPRGSLLGKDFLKGINTEAPRTATPASPTASTMNGKQKAALDRVIGEQIYPYLTLPSGADVELLVAFLDVKLDRNGRVIGTPTVIDVQGINASNRAQVPIYKERAVQAVMRASPFRNLPVEFYDQWKWLSPLRVYARKAL